MTVYTSGPVNIEQGNSANFTIEFQDSTGALTVPSSANLTVTYTNTSFSSQTDTVTLTQDNDFYTGVWPSTSANLGIAIWSATTSIGSSVGAIGQIRVIQRQSTY
jgi:hypothetical protein